MRLFSLTAGDNSELSAMQDEGKVASYCSQMFVMLDKWLNQVDAEKGELVCYRTGEMQWWANEVKKVKDASFAVVAANNHYPASGPDNARRFRKTIGCLNLYGKKRNRLNLINSFQGMIPPQSLNP